MSISAQMSIALGLPFAAGFALLIASYFKRRNIPDSYKNLVQQNPKARLRERAWFPG